MKGKTAREREGKQTPNEQKVIETGREGRETEQI